VKYKYCHAALIWMACMILQAPLIAQIPPLQWTKQFGGSSTDIPYSIKFTVDGGCIIAGYTDSKDGDIQQHAQRDYWDLWILKLDKCGNIQWERSFGGTDYETAKDVIQTSDGGYMIAGETSSTDGDVISGYGSTRDIWVLKLDANGNLQWQKRYGGNGLDIGNNIYPLSDGNFLIAASSSSNDGDITGNHGTGGYTDGVLMKIDASGNMLWSKCYGGSKNDELLNIQVINNKIFVCGYANSTDGDIPSNQKNYDVWFLSTDMDGNKQFSKIYGGSQNDVAYSMAKGTDNTLTLAGYTTSRDGDVSGDKGSQDFWILNLDLNGMLKWQVTAGGTDAEYADVIIADKDGGYIAGGVSYSSDIDVTEPKGEGDYWVMKISAAGKISWKKNLGGDENDHLRSIAYQPALNEYLFAGDTESSDGDFKKGNGNADFGIFKFKQPEIILIDTAVCPGTPFVQVTDTLKDICGYDSAVVMFHPNSKNCEFAYLTKSDTLYIPNAFTPNGDGKNDVFGPAGKIQGEYLMKVFNRNGEIVFQSNDINTRWNGIYRGMPQPTGTFVYIIRYANLHNEMKLKKGSFVLIR